MKKLSMAVIGVTTVALGVSIAVPASAASLTFNFNGVIDGVSEDCGLGDCIFSPSLVGTPVSGSYTFDTKAPDLDSSTTSGAYISSGSPFGATVSFDRYTFRGDYVQISTSQPPTNNSDDFRGSTYGVDGRVEASDTIRQYGFLTLVLNNPSQDVLLSDALPLTPPNVALFEQSRIYFTSRYLSGGESSFSGTITSITPVPEPLTILGSGIALGFGALMKKQYSRKGKKI